MTRLEIPATENTPYIAYREEARTLFLEGEAFPEDVTAFFQPVSAWLAAFLAQPGEKNSLRLSFDLRYFNTSTSKYLFDLFADLEDAHLRDRVSVEVEWRYKAGIDVMRETGEEFAEDFRLPFTFLAYD